jgi:ribosomal-protein-alanine N-acetyltransferase
MTISRFPVLHSNRLTLDALTPEDVSQVYGIFSDPDVIRHYDVERFTQMDQAKKLINYFDALYNGDAGTRWAIRDKKSKRFIGSCGFNAWSRYDYSAVISYELCRTEWGKGYASEAISSIIDYIFSDTFSFYVNRIEALILPSNRPSRALIQKHHFTLEGTLRQKCYWNGDFHDMQMFALLRKDWLAPPFR